MTFSSGLLGGSGGAEKVCITQANYFHRAGHEVTILTNDFINRHASVFFPLDEGIKLINIADECITDRVTQFSEWNNRIEGINPDVIVTSGLDDVDLITRLQTPRAKIINVCNGRPDYDYANIHTFHRSPEWVQRLKTLWYRVHGTNVFFESYKQFLPQDIKAEVRVIPNVVPTLRLSNKTKKRVLFLGSFGEGKNQLQLIKNFVRANRPDWELVLRGNWSSYTDKCLKYLTENNITNVKLLDPAKDIESEFLNASIFASTSLFEGFPLAVTESMSAGLPQISYASCSGSNELIKNTANGFLARNDDEFVFALKYLMDNKLERVRMGNNARESVQKYSEESVMTSWLDFINEVVNETNS